MVKTLLMQVRTELHCVMPTLSFQKDITNWYLDQELEEMGRLPPQRSNFLSASQMSRSDVQTYFVKYTSSSGESQSIFPSDNVEIVSFLVPKAISRLLFPHIPGDVEFAMPGICVKCMMRAIVRNSAEDFWDLTVSELIQMLRATRVAGVPDIRCGVMKCIHDCVAKILNWRIMQAYDVSAAEDFLQLSFLLSAEDGADIAWSQLNMGKQLTIQNISFPFGTIHTGIESRFQEKGVIVAFGIQQEENHFKIAVDAHVARLRSGFVKGLLSFPCTAENTLPTIDLKIIRTQEAREAFLNFFIYYLVPECVSIECALQLWEVSEWMQVRLSEYDNRHFFPRLMQAIDFID
jgi:hypothetical protein